MLIIFEIFRLFANVLDFWIFCICLERFIFLIVWNLCYALFLFCILYVRFFLDFWSCFYMCFDFLCFFVIGSMFLKVILFS